MLSTVGDNGCCRSYDYQGQRSAPTFPFPVYRSCRLAASWFARDDQRCLGGGGFSGQAGVGGLVHGVVFRGGKLTYLKRAARLSDYGWEPADLERLCSNPRELAKLPESDSLDNAGEKAEAFAALVHEASMYYGNGSTVALYRRSMYVARLSALGWSQTQLGSLIGVTKQRVQVMLKEWKKNGPKSRVSQG